MVSQSLENHFITKKKRFPNSKPAHQKIHLFLAERRRQKPPSTRFRRVKTKIRSGRAHTPPEIVPLFPRKMQTRSDPDKFAQIGNYVIRNRSHCQLLHRLFTRPPAAFDPGFLKNPWFPQGSNDSFSIPTSRISSAEKSLSKSYRRTVSLSILATPLI